MIIVSLAGTTVLDALQEFHAHKQEFHTLCEEFSTLCKEFSAPCKEFNDVFALAACRRPRNAQL